MAKKDTKKVKQRKKMEEKVEKWFAPLFNRVVWDLTADMRDPKCFYEFSSSKLEREIVDFVYVGIK